LVWTICGFEV